MSPDSNLNDLVWHDDGHKLWLELRRDELVVLSVTCPREECVNKHGICVVDEFVKRYGLECHVGQCAPVETLQIAWSINGHMDDMDDCQVWVISISDPLFASWRSAQ